MLPQYDLKSWFQLRAKRLRTIYTWNGWIWFFYIPLHRHRINWNTGNLSTHVQLLPQFINGRTHLHTMYTCLLYVENMLWTLSIIPTADTLPNELWRPFTKPSFHLLNGKLIANGSSFGPQSGRPWNGGIQGMLGCVKKMYAVSLQFSVEKLGSRMKLYKTMDFPLRAAPIKNPAKPKVSPI